MVSGSWGTWYDEVRSVALLDLPIRLTLANDSTTRQIEQAVDQLRYIDEPTELGSGVSWVSLPEMQILHDCISDLFELTDSERDLVDGFWAAQRPEASRQISPAAATEGTEADLDQQSTLGIVPYLKVFLRIWNRRLGGAGEFKWRLWRDQQAGVVALVFEIHDSDKSVQKTDQTEAWLAALRRIGIQWESSRAHSILRYGVVRAVTDTAIVIVKRDEQHLWSSRAAMAGRRRLLLLN